jgi:hypothetical protein
MNIVASNKRLWVLLGALFMIELITGWSYERRHAPVLQPEPAK